MAQKNEQASEKPDAHEYRYFRLNEGMRVYTNLMIRNHRLASKAPDDCVKVMYSEKAMMYSQKLIEIQTEAFSEGIDFLRDDESYLTRN